jgi:hypothetical protein
VIVVVAMMVIVVAINRVFVVGLGAHRSIPNR